MNCLSPLNGAGESERICWIWWIQKLSLKLGFMKESISVVLQIIKVLS